MRALIFANGEPNDGPMVQRVLADGQQAIVIAADGGARVARYFGRKVDVVIGDMDSLPTSQLTSLEATGTTVYRYPPEKNETDLELALQWAAEQDIRWIRIIGGIGGRFDQMLANVYLMALPELAERDVMLAAGKQLIRLLNPGEHTIKGNIGDTISLIPISHAVTGIQTRNLRYPLRHETLDFGPARGVSNIIQDIDAAVYFETGLLLLIHTVGRA